MGSHHFHHFRVSHQPATALDNIVAPLCGGGIPFLFGVVFTPIGIYQLAQGDPNMESLGWIFTILGVVMAIVGAVVGIMLWPERKMPAP